MQTILAHFDGKFIVPDQPLSLPAGQALRIGIEAVVTPLPPLPPELETVEYGGIRVRGTRISLFLLLQALDEGETWEQIQERYPTVPRSAVVGLRNYVQQHPGEMQNYLAAERKYIETMRANSTQTLTLEVLRQRAAEKTGAAQP
jgi:uncharacterized protein (DUF433 family)